MKKIPLISIPACLIVLICLLHIGCEENEQGLENNITIASVEVPGGTFQMGSPVNEAGRGQDEFQHLVTVSTFRMSIYEITNTEFAAFLNAKKVERTGKYPAGNSVKEALVNNQKGWGVWYSDNQWLPVDGYENHPVVDVTWFGADEFAKWAGGRLPTEEEWEYACRANTQTAFTTGACLTDVQSNYAWDHPYNTCNNNISSSSPKKTLEVGSYPPNAFGLYDMHGNVWEWCSDIYGGNPDLRVQRGGSWSDEAFICRSAQRFAMPSVSWISYKPLTYGTTGFRIVTLQ